MASGFDIEWETPYEIQNIPDDLSSLESEDSISAEYWIRKASRKHKKITQIHKGLISEMTLERTIAPAVRMKLEEFEEAIITD